MSYIKSYLDEHLWMLYKELTGSGQDAISVSSGGDFAVGGDDDDDDDDDD